MTYNPDLDVTTSTDSKGRAVHTFATELGARKFMATLRAGSFSYWHRSCCAFVVTVA